MMSSTGWRHLYGGGAIAGLAYDRESKTVEGEYLARLRNGGEVVNEKACDGHRLPLRRDFQSIVRLRSRGATAPSTKTEPSAFG